MPNTFNELRRLLDERDAYVLLGMYLAAFAMYVWAVDRIRNGRR